MLAWNQNFMCSLDGINCICKESVQRHGKAGIPTILEYLVKCFSSSYAKVSRICESFIARSIVNASAHFMAMDECCLHHVQTLAPYTNPSTLHRCLGQVNHNRKEIPFDKEQNRKGSKKAQNDNTGSL